MLGLATMFKRLDSGFAVLGFNHGSFRLEVSRFFLGGDEDLGIAVGTSCRGVDGMGFVSQTLSLGSGDPLQLSPAEGFDGCC